MCAVAPKNLKGSQKIARKQVIADILDRSKIFEHCCCLPQNLDISLLTVNNGQVKLPSHQQTAKL